MRRVCALPAFLIVGYLLSSTVPILAADAAVTGPAVLDTGDTDIAGPNVPFIPESPHDIVLTLRIAR